MNEYFISISLSLFPSNNPTPPHTPTPTQIENVVLEVPFPKSVLNVTLSANQGKNSFDPVSKLMTWDVGKIDPAKLPSIKGTVSAFHGERMCVFFHVFLNI